MTQKHKYLELLLLHIEELLEVQTQDRKMPKVPEILGVFPKRKLGYVSHTGKHIQEAKYQGKLQK
jgi:hypothetical protein